MITLTVTIPASNVYAAIRGQIRRGLAQQLANKILEQSDLTLYVLTKEELCTLSEADAI